MTEIRYHIEIILGDLTKVVFEDGYSLNQPGKTGAEAIATLKAYRETRPPHDMSVFRYRNEGKPFCAREQWQGEPVKPSKKRKGVSE